MPSPRSRQTLFTSPALRGFGEAERVAGLFQEIARRKGETIDDAGDEADALFVRRGGA